MQEAEVNIKEKLSTRKKGLEYKKAAKQCERGAEKKREKTQKRIVVWNKIERKNVWGKTGSIEELDHSRDGKIEQPWAASIVHWM